MPFTNAQKGSKWLKEQINLDRRPQLALRAAAKRKFPSKRPSLRDQPLSRRRQDDRDLEARISQLTLDGASPQLRSSHICQAKWRGASSDDEDLDNDSSRGRSSRGSNSYAEEDDEDDDDDDDEVDADLSTMQDPTPRLFNLVKEKDYDDDGEEHVDDDDDDGLSLIDNSTENTRRGKKRKAVYDQANTRSGLGIDDDSEGDLSGMDEDLEEDVDLDAIVGSAFDDDDDDDEEEDDEEDDLLDRARAVPEPPKLPTKAKQHRPDPIEEDDFPPALPLEDDSLMEDDQFEPIMQYAEPPERRYNLADLLQRCGYSDFSEAAKNTEISSIETEWSNVKEGSLYVPLSREGLDPYYAVGTAIDLGATAVLSEQDLCQGNDGDAEVPIIVVPDLERAASKLAAEFYGEPSTRMTVVGVTGSRGKTTTSWLVRGIFEEMQLVTGMVGSLEHSIAVDKMTVDGDLWKPDVEDETLKRDCSTAFHVTPYEGKYPIPEGTPNMVQVQTLMAGMADRGATACVYECGIGEAAAGWANGVDVDVGVYMGFTKEDIDAAGSIESLLEGQKRFFGSLTDPLRQTAVINIDDDYYDQIVDFAKEVPSVTFSMNDDTADVFVTKANFTMWETDVTIQTPAGKLQITSALIGRHNLPNILAAVATGLALTIDDDGIPLKAMINGIRATEIIPGRCEVIDEEQDFGVIIDAANTPESLSRLLDSIRETSPRKIFLVFGCEGGKDKQIRPFMGEIAHYKADLVILTNNNPRGENPNAIVADIVAGYPDEILALNAMQAYPPGFLQDPGRVQFEALEFAWHNCYEFRRYVVEDRWTAIRWAIGTAQKKDIVVVAGKGAEDYQEYVFDGQIVRSWFDDRVECRNALSKVGALKKFDGDIDRKELPWMEVDERADNLRVYNVAAD